MVVTGRTHAPLARATAIPGTHVHPPAGDGARRGPVVAVRPDRLIFRAGLTRLVVGAAAMVMLPILYPLMRAHLAVMTAYMVVAGAEQLLIHKQLGGRVRPFLAGLVDMAMMTFLVHRLGSSATALASLYFFAGILNALVVGLRVGVALASLSAIAYSAVLWAEYLKLLPFAPDVPDLARFSPTLESTLTASVLVTVLLVACTTVVGLLVSAVHSHETELEAANLRLEDLSQRDPLTGAWNRRHLFTCLEHELARVRRGHPLVAVMLDLDRFKLVNDVQGHPRGDQLLKEIAAALVASTRVVDVTSRYGGDEFVIILPDTDAAQGEIVAERVATAVREVGRAFGSERPVTASVGAAMARVDDTAASLVRRADENAYLAKQKGGDAVVFS
jgi:diguanylate cyclase (GGDEF)-like protein